MKSSKPTYLVILSLLLLGTTAVCIFMANYFGKNKALVTLKNESGTDIIGGQIKISSLDVEQEIGPIPNGDSATISFQRFTDGHYVLKAEFRNGKSVRDSGGYVTHGTDFNDRILVESSGDSIAIRVIQKHE